MPEADLVFINHGSVVLVRPATDAGREWLDDNVYSEAWQWAGDCLAVEPRAVEMLACGADCDGLMVSL